MLKGGGEAFVTGSAVSGGGQAAATRAKVAGDGAVGGEEALGMPRALEPSHTPFALAGRLVGVLGAVVQPFVAAMVDAR